MGRPAKGAQACLTAILISVERASTFRRHQWASLPGEAGSAEGAAQPTGPVVKRDGKAVIAITLPADAGVGNRITSESFISISKIAGTG